jgi:hypothetical protein
VCFLFFRARYRGELGFNLAEVAAIIQHDSLGRDNYHDKRVAAHMLEVRSLWAPAPEAVVAGGVGVDLGQRGSGCGGRGRDGNGSRGRGGSWGKGGRLSRGGRRARMNALVMNG